MSRLFWMTFSLIVLGGVGWKLADSIAASTFPALILKDPEMYTLSTGRQNNDNLTKQSATTVTSPELKRACEQTAHELFHNMTAECRILIHPPYVIAGDLDVKELKRHYDEIILPVEKALLSSYFRERPSQPITILLFASDARYQHYAQKLDNRWATGYYGYYNRAEHRILLNVKTGSGTLVHELTHPFAQTDFPTMPEWLDEGLAALHEESDFNKTCTRLIGFNNWRLQHLQTGIQQQKLQSLRKLMTSKTLRSNQQETDYAHARYFCLFLQQKNLLRSFYHEFRTYQINDPYGVKALLRVTEHESLEEVETEFLTWAKQQ